MPTITKSHSLPSDMWRKPKDEGTKYSPTAGNWRERRVSQDSGEGKGVLGNWRVREQKEAAAEADKPKVYRGSIPPEWQLVGMYKQLKVDNAKFTDWLVESVYPSAESRPFYITLAEIQAEDHSKYKIIVNKFPELACRPRKVPAGMVSLLNRLIEERAEYTYWLSQKHTDDDSYDNHLHYIKMLKETRTILAERMEPEATAATQADDTILGKRRPSATTLAGSEQRKSAKMEATTPKPLHFGERADPAAAAEKIQRAEWRPIVAKNCNSTTDNRFAAGNKPMSKAAAARAITA